MEALVVTAMALTNFLLTLIGVGAVAYLMKSDVRTGSATLRRNIKHIRTWLEEQQATTSEGTKEATRQVEQAKPDPQASKKPPP